MTGMGEKMGALALAHLLGISIWRIGRGGQGFTREHLTGFELVLLVLLLLDGASPWESHSLKRLLELVGHKEIG